MRPIEYLLVVVVLDENSIRCKWTGANEITYIPSNATTNGRGL